MADEISDIFDSDSDDSDEEHREAQATVKTYRAQQKRATSLQRSQSGKCASRGASRITPKYDVHVFQSVS